MTTQPVKSAAQIEAENFRDEIRAAFAELREELHNVSAEIEAIRDGLKSAAAAPQPAQAVGSESIMTIDTVIMTYDDKGKKAFKAVGVPFAKFGVRLWDETLPILGIDPATLHPGPNAITPPISARVLMHETTDDSGTPRQSPKKVIGKV